jgi:Cu-processing system ATP-binding protein
MPQIGRYPENMTIGQVFNLMRDIRKPNGAADEELIKSFSLETIKQKRMRTLSGGTRQKVSASLAFLFNPDVLILDEPTAGLDPVSSEIFKEKIIKEKSKGKLIIITSHILSELDDLVTDVIYMQEGKLNFKKSLITLKQETGEQRLSKAVARVMTTLNQ